MDVEKIKEMKMNIQKIGICVPMRGMIHSNFLVNYLKIFATIMKIPGLLPVPIFSDSMPIDRARNDLVRSAYLATGGNRRGCDYLFFMDSDTYVGEEDMITLFNYLRDNDEVQIVSGIYFERAPPYYPVLRREDELGIMRPLTKYPSDPFTVDGIGFGCVMMKRKPMDDLYRKHGGKMFKFTDKRSEDLFWCIEARKLGYKLWVHPEVQCAHEGAAITEWHFLHQKLDQFHDVKELAEYLSQPKPEVLEYCHQGADLVAQEWKKANPKTPEEINEFYKNAKTYIYDLTNWWMRNTRGKTTVFSSINKNETRDVLDYGCGIGDYGLDILEHSLNRTVDFFDINIANIKYLNWRLKKRKDIDDKRYRVFNENRPTDKSYDAILCLDVLEHVPDPEKHLKYFHERLRPNGKLIAIVAPKSEAQPQHITEVDITEYGFVQLSEMLYMKDDSPAVRNAGLVIDKNEKPGDVNEGEGK